MQITHCWAFDYCPILGFSRNRIAANTTCCSRPFHIRFGWHSCRIALFVGEKTNQLAGRDHFSQYTWVIYFGSLQFADLPLAACILAASTCLCLGLIDRPNVSRWLILAGLSAGLAGWTKNEGQLFLLVFLLSACCSVFLAFKQSNPLKLLISKMTLGLLLPLVVILLFQIHSGSSQ